MISDIESALKNLVGTLVRLKNANGAGRAFELYIMTSIALELEAVHQCTVQIQRSDGSRVNSFDRDRSFIQRSGAPSGLPGAGQGAGNMSTFVFRLPGSAEEWEIWNGVQFVGRSGGTHEFDIAIVPHFVGKRLRASSTGGSPLGRPRVAIECKDVQSAGSPDEMRAFLARLYDVTFLAGHNRPSPYQYDLRTGIHPGEHPRDKPSDTFWTSNRENLSVLARRTGFAAGATAISGYYRIYPHGSIEPGSAEDQALIAEVTHWILANLP